MRLRQRGGHGDDGFILMESLASIALLATVLTAALILSLNAHDTKMRIGERSLAELELHRFLTVAQRYDCVKETADAALHTDASDMQLVTVSSYVGWCAMGQTVLPASEWPSGLRVARDPNSSAHWNADHAWSNAVVVSRGTDLKVAFLDAYSFGQVGAHQLECVSYGMQQNDDFDAQYSEDLRLERVRAVRVYGPPGLLAEGETAILDDRRPETAILDNRRPETLSWLAGDDQRPVGARAFGVLAAVGNDGDADAMVSVAWPASESEPPCRVLVHYGNPEDEIPMPSSGLATGTPAGLWPTGSAPKWSDTTVLRLCGGGLIEDYSRPVADYDNSAPPEWCRRYDSHSPNIPDTTTTTPPRVPLPPGPPTLRDSGLP